MSRNGLPVGKWDFSISPWILSGLGDELLSKRLYNFFTSDLTIDGLVSMDSFG